MGAITSRRPEDVNPFGGVKTKEPEFRLPVIKDMQHCCFCPELHQKPATRIGIVELTGQELPVCDYCVPAVGFPWMREFKQIKSSKKGKPIKKSRRINPDFV